MEKIKVLVVIRGGVLASVFSTSPDVEVDLVDWDEDFDPTINYCKRQLDEKVVVPNSNKSMKWEDEYIINAEMFPYRPW